MKPLQIDQYLGFWALGAVWAAKRGFTTIWLILSGWSRNPAMTSVLDSVRPTGLWTASQDQSPSIWLAPQDKPPVAWPPNLGSSFLSCPWRWRALQSCQTPAQMLWDLCRFDQQPPPNGGLSGGWWQIKNLLSPRKVLVSLELRRLVTDWWQIGDRFFFLLSPRKVLVSLELRQKVTEWPVFSAVHHNVIFIFLSECTKKPVILSPFAVRCWYHWGYGVTEGKKICHLLVPSVTFWDKSVTKTPLMGGLSTFLLTSRDLTRPLNLSRQGAWDLCRFDQQPPPQWGT